MSSIEQPSGAARSWFDAATTLIFILDRDGTVVEANASALRYVEGEAVAGALVWETGLVARAPESATALRDAVSRVAIGGQPESLDLDRCDATGARYTAEFAISAAGDGKRLLAEGRDVTTRRAQARRLWNSPHGTPPDLPTALAGVRGALAMLEVGPSGHVSSHLRDSVLLARETADRLMRSVTDLLDLERIRDGSVRIAPIPTSGSDIAAAAVDALTPLAAERRVRLTARDARGGWALADRDRTAQALAILISCAVCAATEGALIRVAVMRPSAERVRLTVEDPAGAIQPSRRAALAAQIEPVGSEDAPPSETDQPITLAALDRACDGDPDVTVGLAIARALVERQGGTIGAATDTHDAAVCWVELPAAPDETASLVLID